MIENDTIRREIESFIERLTIMIRQATIDSVVATLSGSRPAVQFSEKIAAPNPAPAVLPKPTGQRVRRSMSEIERTMTNVKDYVRTHSHSKAEEIKKALNLSNKEVSDALFRLVHEKQMKKKGERRGTEYFL